MVTEVAPKVLSWATDIDPGTMRQAEKTARLPIVAGHVALMPDAHVGIGATVGSVIPTEGAVIPAAVGVDIGCGMIAETELTPRTFPTRWLLCAGIEKAIPAGVGKGHEVATTREPVTRWLASTGRTELSRNQEQTVPAQFGTLGSGNHFFELCVDERDPVWVVLHSGSRGIGNQLAQAHIAKARKLANEAMLQLEDPDLAYFVQGTPEFDAYIADMLWAQEYAMGQPGPDDGQRHARASSPSSASAARRGGSTATTTSPSPRSTPAGSCGSPARAPSRPTPATWASSRARWARAPTSWRARATRPAGCVLARRRPPAQPDQGQGAVHRQSIWPPDGGQGLALGPGRRPGGRDPVRLQGHRPGDGRPVRPGEVLHTLRQVLNYKGT